jgi:hypothetical protein
MLPTVDRHRITCRRVVRSPCICWDPSHLMWNKRNCRRWMDERPNATIGLWRSRGPRHAFGALITIRPGSEPNSASGALLRTKRWLCSVTTRPDHYVSYRSRSPRYARAPCITRSYLSTPRTAPPRHRGRPPWLRRLFSSCGAFGKVTVSTPLLNSAFRWGFFFTTAAVVNRPWRRPARGWK